MTQKAASELLHMSASTLSDQLHRSIERYRHGHRVRGVRVIGIDEVSYHKRHKYATLVYDLERSVVVWGRPGAWPRYHRPVLRSPAQRLPEVTDPHRVLRHERSVHGRDHDSLPQCYRFHVVKALNTPLTKFERNNGAKPAPRTERPSRDCVGCCTGIHPLAHAAGNA